MQIPDEPLQDTHLMMHLSGLCQSFLRFMGSLEGILVDFFLTEFNKIGVNINLRIDVILSLGRVYDVFTPSSRQTNHGLVPSDHL